MLNTVACVSKTSIQLKCAGEIMVDIAWPGEPCAWADIPGTNSWTTGKMVAGVFTWASTAWTMHGNSFVDVLARRPRPRRHEAWCGVGTQIMEPGKAPVSSCWGSGEAARKAAAAVMPWAQRLSGMVSRESTGAACCRWGQRPPLPALPAVG